MGCCTSQVETIVKNTKNVISEADDDKDFFVLTSNGIPQNIDDPVTIIDDISLNPLSLALWSGKAETFKIVKDILGANIDSMNELLEKQDTSAFEIILQKGHLDFLKYYLPLFLQSCNNKLDYIEILQEPLIHIAIFHRHLHVIKYLNEYFSQVCPPAAFDLHHIDPDTGENSALIACKNLDIEMARFLFEICEVNFHIINKNNENALYLCAVNSKKIANPGEFVEFLVNDVRIDTSFRYEEINELFCDDGIERIIDGSIGFERNGCDDDSFSMLSVINYAKCGEMDEDGSVSDIII